MKSIICPISKDRMNQNVARLTGMLVAVSAILYALTRNPFIPVFMVIDFYLRAYANPAYSPFARLAKAINSRLNLQAVMIDKAPKLFAARVGLLFSIVMLLTYPVSPVASSIVSLVLASFALLECVFNFCVGCITYTYVVLPVYKVRRNH